MVAARMLGSLFQRRRPGALSAFSFPCMSSLQQWVHPSRGFSTTAPDWDHVVGIYLGNKYSRVATMFGQYPQMIESEIGPAISSYVAVDPGNEKPIVVGEAAKYMTATNPKDVFFNSKAMIGRKFRDLEADGLLQNVPCKVIEGPDEEAWVRAQSGLFSMDKICLIVLKEIKRAAEAALVGTEFKSLVAVPACFDSDQRARLLFVAEQAGLDVIGVVDEPVLAARANACINDGVIAVFQMGSTSFSVSILHASGSDFEVIESFTDSTVGGDDFDQALLDYYVEQMRKVHSVDISRDEFNIRWLKEEVNRVKTELSSSRQSSVVISTINASATHPLDAKITLHRTNYEQLIQPLLNIIRKRCKSFIRTANLSSIDQVVLSGGMSRAPIIQKVITETFKKNPVMKTDPADSVAVGAALQGVLLIEEKREILPSMLPLSIGIEAVGGTFKKVIHRLTSVPTVQSVRFTTSSGEAQNFRVRVFMGKHGFCSSNIFLGELIDNAKHPPPTFFRKHMEVVFDIKKDKTLTVYVVDSKGVMRNSIQIPLMDTLSIICPKKALKSALSNYQVYQDVFLNEVRNKGFLAMRRFEKAVHAKEKYMNREFFENECHKLDNFVGVLKSDDPKLIEAGIHSAHSAACGLEYRTIVIVRKREVLPDYFDTSISDDDECDSDYSDYYRQK